MSEYFDISKLPKDKYYHIEVGGRNQCKTWALNKYLKERLHQYIYEETDPELLMKLIIMIDYERSSKHEQRRT